MEAGHQQMWNFRTYGIFRTYGQQSLFCVEGLALGEVARIARKTALEPRENIAFCGGRVDSGSKQRKFSTFIEFSNLFYSIESEENTLQVFFEHMVESARFHKAM